MEYLIDSALWIDFSRRKSSLPLKAQILPWLARPDAITCEPVVFEVLRNATAEERPGLSARLRSLPLLPVPESLWTGATHLGQRCRDRGFTVGSFDLLIATTALHHDAEIVTFDGDYSLIAQAEPKLRLQLLTRAA